MDELKGKLAIVTGANTGLGYETAKALYQKGAQVVVACRNPQKAEDAIAKIKAGGPGGSLEVGQLDLSGIESVKDFCTDFSSRFDRLDLLINNAGVMVPPPSKTSDSFELQYGVNFIGHFALTGRLYPLLEQTPDSRVVTLSSIAHRGAATDFENFRLEKPYEPWREYSQSKLACIIFALEFHKRLQSKGSGVMSLAALS